MSLSLESMGFRIPSFPANFSMVVDMEREFEYVGFPRGGEEDVELGSAGVTLFEHYVQRDVYQYFRRGQEFDFESRTHTRSLEEAAAEELVTRHRRVMWRESGSVSFSRGVSAPGEDGSRGSIALNSYANGPDLRTGMFQGREILSGELLGDPLSAYAIILESPSVTVFPETEIVNGYPCRHVVAESEFGRYEMWIDLANGGFARRTRVEKGADDLWKADKSVADSYHMPKPGYVPGSRYNADDWYSCSKVILEMDNIVIENIGGEFLITSATIVEERYFGDEKKEIRRKRLSLRDIDFNPDFEAAGAFTLAGLPDGSFVRDSKWPSARFQLQDGEVIPYLRDSQLRALMGAIDTIEKTTQSESVAAGPAQVSNKAEALTPSTTGVQAPNKLNYVPILFGGLLIFGAVVAYVKLRP